MKSFEEPPQPSESAAGPGIAGGFGTFTPALPTVKKDDEGSEEEEENESTDYITREQLKNRLSKEGKNLSLVIDWMVLQAICLTAPHKHGSAVT